MTARLIGYHGQLRGDFFVCYVAWTNTNTTINKTPKTIVNANSEKNPLVIIDQTSSA